MSGFNPKTAVITGGASGIGLELARRLAGEGTQVLVADLPGKALDQAATISGITAQACDVSDLAQVEALADTAFEQFEAVDLVINNAGKNGPTGPMWEVDLAEARAHYDVNFWGIWNGCRAFIPRLIDQSNPSAIYNTGSENSFFCAAPSSAAYISAKHGVLGLTESLRDDLPAHVHTGLIIPGWVFTPLGPEQVMKFGMEVGEYAAIILPQILSRRRFVVSHGYNEVRIAERMNALSASYKEFALSAKDDEKHDVRLVIEQLRNAGRKA